MDIAGLALQSSPNCTTTVIMMMGNVSMPRQVIPMAALGGENGVEVALGWR